MNLRELMRAQLQFDMEHRGKTDFFKEISDANIAELEHLLVCVLGELGELANVTKKIVRGDTTLQSSREQLEDEIADAFIYLVKICNQLGVDLESAFLKKLAANAERFRAFER